jgi:hypothetical protein
MKNIFSIFVALLILAASDTYANKSIPWVGPTTDSLNSKIEEGWNHLLIGGANYDYGKSRTNFLGVDEWQRGWVSKTPWLEYGFAYAPNSNWEFGLQIPITVLSLTLNTYYSVNDFLKLGIKIGAISSLSSTFTVYPMTDWFISATPSVGFIDFGRGRSKTVNTAPIFSAPKYELIRSSRMIYNGQLAFGRHIDPVDVALLINYSYSPGNGIDNSYVFDDTLMNHFLRICVGFVF